MELARQRVNRNARRRTLVIRYLGDPSFRRHFRMPPVVFERLVGVVGHQLIANGELQRERTPVPVCILMGLWILCNPDTFRSEGLNFGVSSSTVHFHYMRLLRILLEIGHNYIKWPSPMERQRSTLFFERNYGFQGAVGAIDCTHINITAPAEQKQRYVNRHQQYSVNVQIVSDHRRLIRDIFAGQPGSVNDARVFRRSPLSKCLYERNDLLNEDEHILGDRAYATTTKLLTPYRNYGNLTQSHRNYNYMLSKCRSTVERSNSLLKHRLSRLRRLFCKSVETTVMHILSSGVVYNFVLLGGEESDGMVVGDPPNINVEEAMGAVEEDGLHKRRFIRVLLEDSDDEEAEE